MLCEFCGHERTGGGKFCDACGMRETTTCPECGARLSTPRFCSECGRPRGHRPDHGAAPCPIEPHEHHGPPSSGGDAPAAGAAEGERRQLTVMFCDLAGSTQLAGRLDSEELREVICAYQERAAQAVARYEGHVAQYLGDGLLAYFGYPLAHEDDAERAARAGHEIPRLIAGLNERFQREYGIRLQVRVGIHTGPVVVGEIGGGARRETLALGRTTNIAARLEEMAAPNQVVMSDATLRLVPGLFVTQDLGTPVLKGVDEPVRAYRLLQPSGVSSRLEGASRLTPLVGREQEVGLLLDGWRQVEEGGGQAVLISGDPGVGKSRLLYAVRQRIAETPHTWLECRCSPYARNSAFHPMIELLRQGLGFTDSDTEETKLRRLEAGMELSDLPVSEMVPFLAPLLSLPPSADYRPSELSQELQRKRTIEALVAWILALGDRQPVLFVMEDLHWCDPSTLELLDLLLEQVPTARVLTLLAFRPEFTPPWPARSHVRPLALARLRHRQLAQIVDGVAHDLPLPPGLVARIVERADGIPLYVEELTKMVLESGLLVEREGRYELAGVLDEPAIPATLKDSLMARLDLLSTAKRIAQVAAALGREFPYRLLLRVAEMDEAALRAGLLRLVRAELLYQRGVLPNATFTFKHSLIQDTAYESLLRRVRRRLHGRIAEALLGEFPDRAAEAPEIVAYHYDRAGQLSKAIHFYQLAGDQARSRSSNAEAIAHLGRGLELTGRLPEGPQRRERELGLQLSLGGAELESHGFAREETRRAWERARELAESDGTTSQLAEALIGLSMFHQTRSELDAATRFGEQLIALGNRTGGKEHLFAGSELLGNATYWQGRFRDCLGHYDAAIEIFEPTRDVAFAKVGGFGHGLSSWALWALGYPDRAAARADDMVERARALGYPYGVGFALMVASVLFMLRREWETTNRYAEECIEFSEQRGFPLWLGISKTVRAVTLACSQGKDAMEEVMEALNVLLGTSQKAGLPLTYWQVARIQQEAGLETEALGTVAAALKASDAGGQRFMDAELMRLQGELLTPRSEAKAESILRRAVETAREQEARSFELRAATTLARLLKSRGEEEAARRLLGPVHGWFSEGFDTQDLEDAGALLDSIA